MKPADFPVGKWYVDGELNLWDMPCRNHHCLIDIELSREDGTNIKLIKVATTAPSMNTT